MKYSSKYFIHEILEHASSEFFYNIYLRKSDDFESAELVQTRRRSVNYSAFHGRAFERGSAKGFSTNCQPIPQPIDIVISSYFAKLNDKRNIHIFFISAKTHEIKKHVIVSIQI